jgi:predicted transcriptional regulator
MVKTSVYLDEELKSQLSGVSERTGRSEADLIREGVEQVVSRYRGERERVTATFRNGGIVARIEELMEGFGR